MTMTILYLIFRTSLYKSRKPINYFSIPAFCNDLKNETKYFFREKNLIPTIGFCGAITHQYRKEIINYINNINNLKKNFIIRNDFWGGNIWGSNVRNEYINNTLNSDFVICVRGAGNFSYRFYETLCLGRIPIVLDTDLDLPFNDFIDYDNKILIIKINEINTIEHKILTFWDNIIDYKKLQLDLINFWSETLSPIGFIKTLNTHKNEINNILYYTHKQMFDEYFLPSIKKEDEFEIISKEGLQYSSDGNYFSNGFNETTRDKIKFLYDNIISLPDDEIILFSDVDVIFLKPLKSFLSNFINYDMVFQNGYGGLNTGFFLLKNKQEVRNLLKKVIDDCHLYENDQIALNDIIKHFNIEKVMFSDEILSTAAIIGTKIWDNDEFKIPENTLVFHACWCAGINNKINLLNYVRNNK